tara:strand:+ start:91 stop:711 length:621 start_codon:yes stop_codon:yes gene_type:complete
MKKILLLSSFIFICSQVFSQISATTNSGDSVILNSDGTWNYKNKTTANIIGLGNWEIKYFVDEFGDPTNTGYITTKELIEGSFSNSASSNAGLLAQFIIKDAANVGLKLYEYKSNVVKAYSTKSYSVIIKDSEGSKHTMNSTIYKGGDRLFIDDSYKKNHISKFHKLLVKGGNLTIIITDSEYGLTNYKITVNGDGYKNAFETLYK